MGSNVGAVKPTPEMVAMAERIANAAPGDTLLRHVVKRAALVAIIETTERAAALANLRALDAWNEAGRLGQTVSCASGRNQGARDLCTAIRNGEHLR